MKLKMLSLVGMLLFATAMNGQSVFGKPVTFTWDRSTSDTPDFPKGVYFTYRTTLNPLTGGCNAYLKVGGSGNLTTFTDTQMVPGITYCYKEVFYANGTQSPQSDFPVIVTTIP